jgi:hypothetical protein
LRADGCRTAILLPLCAVADTEEPYDTTPVRTASENTAPLIPAHTDCF